MSNKHKRNVSTVELAKAQPQPSRVETEEIGTPGLSIFAGLIREAYTAELQWPKCAPLYSRLRRSDPEITMVRQAFTTLARKSYLDVELPDEPTDDDKRYQEFCQQVFDDMAGGQTRLLEGIVAHVPFMGWYWWEALPGIRSQEWGKDGWQSEYDDGLIGFREFAPRDTSSFLNWEMDETEHVTGLKQFDPSGKKGAVIIPLSNSLHLTFGDAVNPEGLSPLEAVWRLERIKYGLEVIQGIGFEHAAGYLNVKRTEAGTMSGEDLAKIKQAARAILTAQEGNYAAWPYGIEGQVMDIPFSASSGLLEAIKYYGILKLTLFNMQWVALSSVSGAGSYSAMSDSSSMFMQSYNGMMEGFARQIDEQIGKRLWKWNSHAFPGATKRPRIIIPSIEKQISLGELASILGPIKSTMPLGDEDFKAIRKAVGFLPETLPEIEEPPAQEETPADDTGEDTATTEEPEVEGEGDETPEENTDGEMMQRLDGLRAELSRANDLEEKRQKSRWPFTKS